MGDAAWWGFLIFFGILLLIALIVVWGEKKIGDETILLLNPLIVLRNIFLIQLSFYGIYLFTVFSLDLIAAEPFWSTQVFTSLECSFFDRRGLVAFFGLILSLASLAIPLTTIVRQSSNMLDYCFTVSFLHFVVVCCVIGGFPASGAWWTSLIIGLLFAFVTTEFVSHRLELMSYQSTLARPTNNNEPVRLEDVGVDLKERNDSSPQSDRPTVKNSRHHQHSSRQSSKLQLENSSQALTDIVSRLDTKNSKRISPDRTRKRSTSLNELQPAHRRSPNSKRHPPRTEHGNSPDRRAGVNRRDSNRTH